MGWESNPFAGPQVDFTDAAEAIGSIPQRLRDRELRGQNFIDPKTGAVDYNRMSQALMAAGHTKEAITAANAGSSAENKYALNAIPFKDPKTGKIVYKQLYSGGGARDVDSGGMVPMMPYGWQEGENGLIPLPKKMAPGIDTPGAQDGVNITPPMFSGGPQQAPQGATPPTQQQPQAPQGIPTPGSNKAKHELASNKATDKAMSMQAIQKFEENIRTMENLVDAQGNPSKQLGAVTGNYKLPEELGGGPGGTEIKQIPNSWVPIDYSENARNARANLDTAAIQIGLNALADMRAASAQGASGMGQLAIQESEWLQKSIRNLQDSQGTPQAAVHVREVMAYSRLVQQRIKEKYKEVYGEDLPDPVDISVPPPGAPAAAAGPAGEGDNVFVAPNGAKVRLKQ